MDNAKVKKVVIKGSEDSFTSIINAIEYWSRLGANADPKKLWIRDGITHIISERDSYYETFRKFKHLFNSIGSNFPEQPENSRKILYPESADSSAAYFVGALIYVRASISTSIKKLLDIEHDVSAKFWSYQFDDSTDLSMMRSSLSFEIARHLMFEANARYEIISATLDSNKDNTEERYLEIINELKSEIKKYSEIKDASYKELENSFSIFMQRKQKEKMISLIASCFIACAAIFFAYLGISEGGFIEPVLKSIAEDKMISHQTISFITIEALLIYFFRICLNNYYSARDECLQLEIREALCKFAPHYVAFSDGEDDKLSDFAKHMFSPMVSNVSKSPHPIDFAGQLTDLAKAIKKGS